VLGMAVALVELLLDVMCQRKMHTVAASYFVFSLVSIYLLYFDTVHCPLTRERLMVARRTHVGCRESLPPEQNGDTTRKVKRALHLHAGNDFYSYQERNVVGL
jgi:hypothetical protein